MPCHCTGNAQVARNVQITEKRKSMQGIFHSFPFVSSCAFSKAAYLVCTCQTRNRCLFASILDSLELLSWDDGFGLIPIVVWCRKCAVTKYHARFPVGLTFISVYLEDDFWVPLPRLFFLVGLLLAQFSHCSHVRLLGIRGTRSVLAHTVQQRWTAVLRCRPGRRRRGRQGGT